MCMFMHACSSLFQFLKENNLLFLFYGYDCSASMDVCSLGARLMPAEPRKGYQVPQRRSQT